MPIPLCVSNSLVQFHPPNVSYGGEPVLPLVKISSILNFCFVIISSATGSAPGVYESSTF